MVCGACGVVNIGTVYGSCLSNVADIHVVLFCAETEIRPKG